jgi:hypothetical protein
LKCLADNSRIENNSCVCDEGFWNSSDLSNKDSCQPCLDSCLECENSERCSKCLADNSRIENNSCVCDEGFWNSSALSTKDSCQPCNNLCKTCNQADICLDCKDERASLTPESKCKIFCTDEIIEGCFSCGFLCKKCFENQTCYECAKNSIVDDEKCSCLEGFYEVNETCTEKWFYWNISVNKVNKVLIEFTENVNITLLKHKLKLRLGSIQDTFDLIGKSKKTFYLISKNAENLSKTKIFKLSLNNEEILSENGSKLFNSSFEGYFYKINITSGLNPTLIKTGIQVMTSTTIAISISSNPTAFFAFLNTIQFICYMPLNSVAYPQRLKHIANSFIDYNILPNFFVLLFTPNSTSVPYPEALNFGIETSVFLINVGKNFNILIVFIFAMAVLKILTKIFKGKQNIEMLWEKNKFNLVLGFFINMYLELGFYGVIQLKSVRTI